MDDENTVKRNLEHWGDFKLILESAGSAVSGKPKKLLRVPTLIQVKLFIKSITA